MLRTHSWAVLVVLLVVVGTMGSWLAASGFAHSAGQKSHKSFVTSSAEVAATLQLAVEHEQDLIVSAQTFVLGNPTATEAQFVQWADDMNVMRRYPELQGIGSMQIIPASHIAAFSKLATTNYPAPFVIVPPGKRPFYCLAVINVVRNAGDGLPPGFDLCAGASGQRQLASRGSGQEVLAPIVIRKVTALALGVPIYKGGSLPTTAVARRAAFAGWVGMSIVPCVILTTALQGHPNTAVALRYGGRSSTVVFRTGRAPSGAQVASVNLHNGWTVQIFAAISSGGVLGNASSLALFIAGIALSLLFGFVIHLLGTGRARATALVLERTEQLHFQALHDSLTGLPNRELILDRTGQMLARAHRSHLPVAAMFLDLDDFKDINDTLGHDAGDQLLVAVSSRLVAVLREGDTVGRLGGDEFVLLVEGDSLSAGAEVVADRILEVLQTPFEIAASVLPLSVSASIGIATGYRLTPQELLRDADIALYRAKAAGKRCSAVFAPSMQAAAQDRRHMAVDLHNALGANQFFLVYQPTIDLQTNAFTGVEALLRWRHPDRGVVLPDEFIPALEASGLIVPVGAWVLDEACRQGAIWHTRGHRFTVSVNVSRNQLERYQIVDDVHNALTASGFDPSSLILELTETTLMNDVEETIARLGLLKALGVRLAVDDFGTGYSSLAYLRRFPIDVLKIDRAFVSGITDSLESAALVHTLVKLGKILQLETIAEGIEDDDQRTCLQAEKVDVGQGFFFSRPLDADAIDKFLEGFTTTNPVKRANMTAST